MVSVPFEHAGGEDGFSGSHSIAKSSLPQGSQITSKRIGRWQCRCTRQLYAWMALGHERVAVEVADADRTIKYALEEWTPNANAYQWNTAAIIGNFLIGICVVLLTSIVIEGTNAGAAKQSLLRRREARKT